MSTRMNKVIVSVIIIMLVLFILALVSGIVNQETIAGQAIKLGGGNFLNPGAKLGTPKVSLEDSIKVKENNKNLKIKNPLNPGSKSVVPIDSSKKIKGIAKIDKKNLPIKDIPKKIIKVNPEKDSTKEKSQRSVSDNKGVDFEGDVVPEIIEEPKNPVLLTEGSIANYYSVDKIDGLTFKLEKELYSENVMLKNFVNGEWVDLNIEKINEDKNFVYYRINE